MFLWGRWLTSSLRCWEEIGQNFSFTSLSIANVLVFTAANVAGCLLVFSAGPVISSVLLMANRQRLQKRLVLALCHNLHCIHVGSCCCLFSVCPCPWVCHWLFRGFEPWLIGRLVCTVQIRCTAGIDGRVPDCMLFISSMRREQSKKESAPLYPLITLAPKLPSRFFVLWWITFCIQILHIFFLLHYIY